VERVGGGAPRVRADKHDVCLRRFQYSKALDCVMDVRVRTKAPAVVVGVLRELIRRDGLRTAVAGRGDEDLARVLTFILKNIGEQQYVHTLLDVLSIVLDLYRSRADLMVRSREVMSRLDRALELTVDATLDKCAQLGVCDVILSAAEEAGPRKAEPGAGRAEPVLIHGPMGDTGLIKNNDTEDMDTGNGD